MQKIVGEQNLSQNYLKKIGLPFQLLSELVGSNIFFNYVLNEEAPF